MTAIEQRIRGDYPRTVTLENKTEVTLRLMTGDDIDRITAFARGQPEEDLLFLQIDITDRAAVEQWAQNQSAGRLITLIAEADGEMAGYGALIHNQTNWQRHLGEIRILAGRRFRGLGLGRALAAELFTIARDLGLRKLTAQMPRDQQGAKATFERLGFQPEALLQDFVIDHTGVTHDLVLMTYDLEHRPAGGD